MRKGVFEKGFETLCHRYNKPFKESLASVYLSRIGFIPDRPFEEIIERIIDDSKYFQSPGDIKRGWFLWRNEHPESKKKRQYLPCDYCNGEGALTVRMLIPSPININENAEYDSLCRCGHCNNWQEVGLPPNLPLWTSEQIQSMGHKWVVSGVVVDEENPWPPKFIERQQQKSVEEAVNNIANKHTMPKEQEREERIAELRQQGQQIQDDTPF